MLYKRSIILIVVISGQEIMQFIIACDVKHEDRHHDYKDENEPESKYRFSNTVCTFNTMEGNYSALALSQDIFLMLLKYCNKSDCS